MFEVNISLTLFFFFFAMEIYLSIYLCLSDWPLHLDCTSSLTLTQSQTYFLEKTRQDESCFGLTLVDPGAVQLIVVELTCSALKLS